MVTQNNLTSVEIDKLRSLYFGNTKHASYQPVPQTLEVFFSDIEIDKKWRHPGPRIELLKQNLLDFNGNEIIEIGSNTGYQIIELAKFFPHILFKGYEISKHHTEFVEWCIRNEGLSNIEMHNCEFNAETASELNQNSAVLDFNVVHHAGSDFLGNLEIDSETWWNTILPNWLSRSSKYSDYWFSTGFRLGGNAAMPLLDPLFPSRMISRITNCIESIHPLMRVDTYVISNHEETMTLHYKKLQKLDLDVIDNELSVLREREIYRGEFFTRPLFHIYHHEG